jgi:choline dehydrogenase-like flavoprotein
MTTGSKDVTEFDAIVVGSGITGGWAAKELTERGVRTLVLERGRHMEHGPASYVTEHLPTYAFRYRLLGDRRKYARDFPSASQLVVDQRVDRAPVGQRPRKPVQHARRRPFHWFRGHHLGGRS